MLDSLGQGVINKGVRFSVGDLFLKQSKFTLYNYDEELSKGYENDMLKPYRDIIHYENFYTENRWRLQEFKLIFHMNLTDILEVWSLIFLSRDLEDQVK